MEFIMFFIANILGDPDQSIYSWRFAKPQLVHEIMKEFSNAAVYKLEQNYRSTKCIVEASDAVINQGKLIFSHLDHLR
jgi:DNA helicase II / ATP-dependent DNA helicase PcrA